MRKNRQKYRNTKAILFLMTIFAALMCLVPDNFVIPENKQIIISTMAGSQTSGEVETPYANGGRVCKWGDSSPHADESRIINMDNVSVDVWEYSTYTGYLATWGYNWTPLIQQDMPYIYNVSEVKIMLYLGKNYNTMHTGYFSFTTDYWSTGWYSNAYPWTCGNWTNSSTYPYTVFQPFGTPGFAEKYRGAQWDITSQRQWNLSMLINYDSYRYPFRVMWTFTENTSHQYFDYLGIWSMVWQNFSAWNTNLPVSNVHQYFEINFNALLWMLIVFLPTILINESIPKLGFFGGIFLMLIVVGMAEPTFIPFMLVSMLALGVVIYKGE